MGNVKKILSSVSGLATVSVVLIIALVALFITNHGFGWFAEIRYGHANGMMVSATAPDSPVESFQFYIVEEARVIVVEATENTEEYVHNQYLFVPPKDPTVEMNMGDYSKLTAPTYHILLHVVFKPGVDTVWMDTHVDGEEYTLILDQIQNMVSATPPVSLGMSSALEFYVLDPDHVDPQIHTVTNEDGKEEQVTWFTFDDIDLPAESLTFDQTPIIDDESGELTGYTYSSMDDVLLDLANPTGEAETGDNQSGGNEQHELFLFITYSAERIALLQEYAGIHADGEDDGGIGGGDILFHSDFFIFFRRDN